MADQLSRVHATGMEDIQGSEMNGRSVTISLPIFVNLRSEIGLTIKISWITGGFLSNDRVKHDGVNL